MKVFFKKENLKNTILTLVYLVFGILFCVTPVKMFNFVESALCFLLLATGIICVLIYSLMSSEDKIFKLMLYGIIALALGICMMLFPRLFGIILSLLVGYSGVSLIVSSLKTKKKCEKIWITDFVVGIIVTSLSVVTIVLSGTNSAKKLLAIFFGIILLINGIYSLIQVINFAIKEKEKNEQIVSDVKIDNQDKTIILNSDVKAEEERDSIDNSTTLETESEALEVKTQKNTEPKTNNNKEVKKKIKK